MCLAIPGRIVEIYEEQGLQMGKLDFGGTIRKCCLAVYPRCRGRRLCPGPRWLCAQHHRCGRGSENL